MTQLLDWLSKLFGSWKFWVIVAPWDVGLRVRLGRRAVALQPGPHFRIPFLDEIVLVNTRQRVQLTPTVTVQSGERVRVRTATIGYRISDPLLATMAYEHPHVSVQGYVLGVMSAEVLPSPADCIASLNLELVGLRLEFLTFCDDVEVPGLRLLNMQAWLSDRIDSGPRVGEARY